ncbi:MAG TPA: Nudix family hydrolase [Rugosibacter sp.]
MKITHVAAAVIERANGQFLLGQRAADTFYPGYWEFPGGKVEPGETAREALMRELHEELGIKVLRADPWLHREHIYEHAHVHLNFFRVRAWQGEISNRVHSALAWQTPGALSIQPMLPANAPVLAALALPVFYAITHAAEIGVTAQLEALDHALENGLKLVQLREPMLSPQQREAFVHAAVKCCHSAGARVLINSDPLLALAAGADGLHLTSAQLATCSTRPEFPLVAASCHSPAELMRAAQIGCDFVVYGSIHETATHPGKTGLGWAAFAAEINNPFAVPPTPTFALGGLSLDDLDIASASGAHGIAAIRSAW